MRTTWLRFACFTLVGVASGCSADLEESAKPLAQAEETVDDEPGRTCSTVLFETNDACLAEAGSVDGDLDGSGEIDTDEEFELVSHCWIEVANVAYEGCCAATPDETCETGEDDGGEDDGREDDGGVIDGTCAGVMFEANNTCLAEAGSVDGDLDGSGDIDQEDEFELVARCWIEVAGAAFDACCAATPDETCDTGEGDGGDGEDPREEPGEGTAPDA